MPFLEPITPRVPPGKSPFLQWPTLGGKLTILNCLGWAVTFGAAQYSQSPAPAWASWLILFLLIVLSFPLLWGCISLAFLLQPPADDSLRLLAGFLVGINSIVWGYGLVWLWPKLRKGIQVVSIRSYQVTVVALFCIGASLGWYCWTLYQQQQSFSLIESRCRDAEDSGKDAPQGLETDFDVLTLHALVRDYDEYIKQVGPRLEPAVTHHYQQALKQVMGRLRKEAPKDLGDDPKVWIKASGL
jgi:hypothetical protein